MLLWMVMAVLTAIASLSILVPLYRRRRGDRSYGNEQLSVYRDQLGEVERDVARGLIGEDEAEAARTEISRRILRASDAADKDADGAGNRARWMAAAVAVVAVPLAALGLYLSVGSPDLPDQPIAARMSAPPQDQDIAVLIARVEAHLAANPDDARGWELLGPVYGRMGRYDDAAVAFANTVRLLGPTAEREADLGEAIMRANGDVVTPEAQAAFERALALDETAIRPRFYLAVALDQQGRTDEAIAAWHELLDGAPEDAPWVAIARQALARLEGTPVADAGPAAAAPGPSAEDVQAAAAMTPEERMAMIGGMVDSLAARLEAEPDDAQGWARLIRSYMVLGRADDASAALATARDQFGGNVEKLAIVEAQARDSGLIEAPALLEGGAAPAAEPGPSAVARGPSAEDVQAAAAMTPEERMAMIGGMVDSLAARLEAEPDDAQGWARLIRSYIVLGRTDDANAALATARDEFDGDAQKLAIVEAQARESGLIE